MAFQVSPGINVSEIDLTTIVPTVSTTTGALAGLFRWGPVGELVLISSATDLANRFGKPTNFNAETWFTGSNFLDYGNALIVSRAANTIDSSANGTLSAIADTSGLIAANVAANTYYGSNVNLNFTIDNSDDYYNTLAVNGFTTNTTYAFVAKYPGILGSSLAISIVDSPAGYSSNLVGVANVALGVNSNTGTINFNDSYATINAATVAANLASYVAWSALTVGDFIQVGNSSLGTQYLQVATKGAAPVLTTITGSTNSNNTITGLATTANIAVGMTVVSTTGNVPSNTVVTSVVNSSAVQLSNAAVSTASVTLNFAQEFLSLRFNSPYTLAVAWTPATTNVARVWQYYSAVTAAPGTSDFVAAFGNTLATDEVHVVVSDALGKITGTPGTILEVYQGLSRATDAKTQDGATNYYVNVLNQNSQYVWWTNHRGGSSAYVANAALISTYADSVPLTLQFTGGREGFNESNVGTNIGAITAAYDLFKSTETSAISLIMTGKSDDVNQSLLGNYILQNICAKRLDCVAFVSPHRAAVVNNLGYEAASIATFRNGLGSTSYGVLDTGYKYQYDKYNDVYRYIPLNGDIAGLCVQTDTTRDPWWSPAGFNRGQIKNVIKLAYNPSKTDRDFLYPQNINPVVTFPGQGTVLFGDKTLQTKPSAFDRINVRRLFIVLEKTISAASQYQLFEFNDVFTRAQFVSLVTPFLKDVKGRRGITDFQVVCDSTNNTGQVIDANQFVGDIYIKPARSINYIQLNFVAVRTDVSFAEIIGSF